MTQTDDELPGKAAPDDREGEQTQSDMPAVKSKDDFDRDPEPKPAEGEPTLPADRESHKD